MIKFIGYHFHPVGQGLFSSGKIQGISKPNGIRNEFNWVYDCGTSSSHSLITREIDILSSRWIPPANAKKPILDLVMISHFDKDHTSGLVDLIKRFRVKKLLLPYMPFWQRIFLAFERGISFTSAEFDIFLNPISFISGIPGREIDQILFCPGIEDERIGAELSSNENNNPSNDNNSGWDLSYLEILPDENDYPQELKEENQSQGQIPIVLLKPKSTLQIQNEWEFIPYNDCKTFPKPPPKFISAVEIQRKILLSGPNKASLGRLKKLYDSQFGKTSKTRNGISLYMYAGPQMKSMKRRISMGFSFQCNHTCDFFHSLCPFHYIGCNFKDLLKKIKPLNSIGILYTGDGYLDTPNKLADLIAYLKKPFRQILCFQVMHHGSKDNWHAGMGSRLNPLISVFSSNPYILKPGHPHPDVWKDFIKFGRTQVDEDWGLSILLGLN